MNRSLHQYARESFARAKYGWKQATQGTELSSGIYDGVYKYAIMRNAMQADTPVRLLTH